MKLFLSSLLLVIFCYHICFGEDDRGEVYVEGDCINGRGAITFYDGSRYDGQFKEGNLHGQGILNFADGSRYTGEFENGEMNGKGTMAFSDSSEYVGEFKNGTLCGQGTLTFPDGSVYNGQFKDGQYHGRGAWSTPDGIRYEGQFKDGKFDGEGIYSLPDGSRYIGLFKDDDFHGQGAWIVDDISSNTSDSPQPMQKETGTEYEADLPGARATPSAGVAEPDDAVPREGGGLAFSVQVGAFLSKENAEKLATLLREKGYDAYLLPLNDGVDRSWYTVRLGSYGSLEEAQEKAAAFSEKEKITAAVRPVDSL